jgi:hypothetical protein
MSYNRYLDASDLKYLRNSILLFESYKSNTCSIEDIIDRFKTSVLHFHLQKISTSEKNTILHSISKKCFSFTDTMLYFTITGGSLIYDMKQFSELLEYFIVTNKNDDIKNIIKGIVISNGISILSTLNAEGYTPYTFAVKNNNTKNIQILTELGANK